MLLQEIEDVILAEIDSHTPAILTLVLTTGTMKEFVFYIPEGVDIRSIHESVQATVPSHEVQCIGVREPKWDSYRQFSPE